MVIPKKKYHFYLFNSKLVVKFYDIQGELHFNIETIQNFEIVNKN